MGAPTEHLSFNIRSKKGKRVPPLTHTASIQLTRIEEDWLLHLMSESEERIVDLNESLKRAVEQGLEPMVVIGMGVNANNGVSKTEANFDVYRLKLEESESVRRLVAGHLVKDKELEKNGFKLLNTPSGLWEFFELPSQSDLSQKDKQFLKQVYRVLEKQMYQAEFSVKDLETQLGVSHASLYRRVSKITGLSVSQMIRKVRIRRAKELLLSGHNSISEIAYSVGYSDPSYFSRTFKNATGLSPSKFRERLDCDVNSGGIKD